MLWRGALASTVLVVGCATAPGLPLSSGALVAAREGARRGPPAVALRDLGWLELLYGSGPDGAGPYFERSLAQGHDALALLGRALVLSARGDRARQSEAWLDLLGACGPSPEGVCAAAAGIALMRLANPDAAMPAQARRRLEALARRGPPWRRELALGILARLASRRGDVEELGRLRTLRGCPAAWSVSGPWHRNAHVDLGRPVPSGGLRDVPAAGCQLELRSAGRWGGVYRASTDVILERARRLTLIVETGGPWELLLSGKRLWRHDALEQRRARRVLELRLPPGRHRLGLKVGAPTGFAKLELHLVPSGTRPGPPVRFVLPRGGPVDAAVGVRAASRPCWDPAPRLDPQWYAPLSRFLSASSARRCGELDRVHRDLAEGTRWAPRFAAPHLLLARVVQEDPLLPRTVGTDEAMGLLRSTLERDPGHADAMARMATLLLSLGEEDAALGLLRAGSERWPSDPRWPAGLARVYRERSFVTEEERALDRAAELDPRRCGVLEQLAGIKRLRKDVTGQLRAVFAARSCDAGSPLLARSLRDSGALVAAVAEYRRVLSLRPQAAYLRRELVQALHLLGRDREAVGELRAVLVTHPGSVEDLIEEADLLGASRGRAPAVAALELAHHRVPWESELRRTLERLTGRSVMSAHRLDGRQVIERFRRRGRRYDAPAVVVQDRLVTRFFEDGSSISLTHNIVQVLTKSGMERWGEASIPEGAEILTLRTVKTDGSTREPEEIVGKSSISLPALEPGDFIEIEYLDAAPPPRELAGAALGPRFYFASFDVPLVRSEYVALAPTGLPLVFDRRGDVPPPRRAVRDGVVVLRWSVEDRPRTAPEPHLPPPDEFVPSVRVIGGVRWEGWRDYFLELAMDATRPSWLVREVAARVAAGHAGDVARARALYRWTVREIEAGGTTLSSATGALATKRGSRGAVLAALLRAQGIPAQLWLARPKSSAGGTARDVPEAEGFTRLLVRCVLDGEARFLEPEHRFVPFGYVSPALRGALALRLGPGAPLATVPRLEGLRDRRRVRLQVVVATDGSARVRAVERLEGLWGIRMRHELERIDPSRLNELFEQRYLGASFPGASLERLRVVGAQTIDKPLELRFGFRAPNLCRREHGRLRCPVSFFPPNLTREYVKVARRELPLLVGLHPRTEVSVRLEPPASYRSAAVPGTVRRSGPFGELTLRSGRLGRGALRSTLVLDVVHRRVAPGDYPRFVRFARQVDRAFEAELEFAPR